MKLRNLVFACIAGLGLTNSALAMKSCPFPMGLQASMGVANEAISAKEKGTKKEELLAQIPPETPDNAWVTSLMREITHEVYDFPDIPATIYTTYRGEMCFQAMKNQDVELPINYSDALPMLQSCMAETSEKEQRKCAIRVVDKLVGATQ